MSQNTEAITQAHLKRLKKLEIKIQIQKQKNNSKDFYIVDLCNIMRGCWSGQTGSP